MIFLFIAVLIAVPYVLGTALTIIFGDRSTRGNIRWVIGILYCFAYFFVCLLIALKLDADLNALCRLFGIFTAAFLAGSIPVVIFGFSRNKVRVLHYDNKILSWLIPAVCLGVFSIVFLKPDFSNDITVETVRTTLYSNRLYEYSSLLGTKMEAGLPIFNKIEIMPMLYACLGRMFRVDPLYIIRFIAPVVSYVSNLFVTWEIATILVKDKHKNLYMIFHLLILIAGTYLPANAIPVTMGQPLLRQGYSGYAFCYGVLVPAMVLALLQKRYFLSVLFLVPFLGLVKLDRLFFSFKEFFTSYNVVNSAGKLLTLYFVGVIWWLIRRKNKVRIPRGAFLSGATLACVTFTDMYDYFGEKKTFPVFAGVVIMGCCSFFPFKGAEFVVEHKSIGGQYFDFDGLLAEGDDNIVLWAPNEVMDAARRENPRILPVYGRDMYNKLLAGSNYEAYDEEQEFLCYAIEVLSKHAYDDEYLEITLKYDLEENRTINDVDVIVLRTATQSEVINKVFYDKGFSFDREYKEYTILRRGDSE